MGYPEDGVVQTWLDALQGLNVRVKKMFGCYCLYCDNQPVGWLHEGVLSLREVGLTYLPDHLMPLPMASPGGPRHRRYTQGSGKENTSEKIKAVRKKHETSMRNHK